MHYNGMNTWTGEKCVCNVRKESGSFETSPNKDFLGSKDSKKRLGSPTFDLVRIHRQCLGFTKVGRKSKGDSSIENKYDFEAFITVNQNSTNVKTHLSEVFSR